MPSVATRLQWPAVHDYRVLLLFVALAQAADAITFAIVAPIVGIRGELNPLGRLTYMDATMWGTFAFKGALVVVMLVIIAHFQNKPRLQLILAAIAGGLGLVGALSNVLAIGGY